VLPAARSDAGARGAMGRHGAVDATSRDPTEREDPVGGFSAHRLVGEIPGVRIYDILCTKRSRRWTTDSEFVGFGLVLVRQGGFSRRAMGIDGFADATSAFFHPPYMEQLVSHPRIGGDRSTAMTFTEDAITRYAGDGWLPTGLLTTTAELDLLHRQLIAELGGAIDTWQLEVHLTELVGSIVELGLPGRLSRARAGTTNRHRRLADQVRESIAADPAGASLHRLSRELGYSPFHVCRTFGRVTGETMTAHRNRVRVTRALERLMEGEQDLAGLALDLGFADQSHLARVVRGLVGSPPSHVRRLFYEVGRPE
jgi:AraC-like DNA-binding protein